jgi:hypothetical protein
MAIHTSAIFYRRGIPNSYSNFAFVAQANNIIPSPISSFIHNYQFYNRNKLVFINGHQTLPWRK